MKCYTTSLRLRKKLGFTLTEAMVSFGLAGVVLTALVILYAGSARSFVTMSNYVDLDAKSRDAMDTISREIRNASQLTDFSTNSPKSLTFYNATAGKTIKLEYDSDARTLTLKKTGKPDYVCLTQCDRWDFVLYDRYPLSSTNIDFHVASDKARCKLVNMSWKCSRTIFGTKITTESAQTAEIMLRNKVD